MNHKITEIFYLVDELCKEFDRVKEGRILTEKTAVKQRNRKYKMSDSEVITIVILFHLKGYRCLKHFYIQHVQKHMKSEFPETVSYNRFVELKMMVLPKKELNRRFQPFNSYYLFHYSRFPLTSSSLQWACVPC